ncbi:DNA (cytosine-5-)-methyltransferase [Paenibacillus anseongense]|uniref:DNA cytosine methyltransferase n=1 Tax=Paenibacillus anseongense TaxID=2682845 RepID=UPI002DB8F5BC|nr:DNA (cytosine-5-)-methyltransferase [Paenibacillus anseongense]MEC0269720.1 DNA (cytosine-5-)-methyltransferase [Paenibacillus anseongense]
MEESKEIAVQTYTVGSLFAGIGGFCRAFMREGFRVLWANEIDPFACQTYRHNYPEVKLYEKPIEELSVTADHLQPVDVLTAGFPCQSFSMAGNKLGFEDPRGRLFFQIIRLLNDFGKDKPKIIVLENVRNLLNHDNGKTIEIIGEELRAAGYLFRVIYGNKSEISDTNPNIKVLNTSSHTTIPQNRERLYMVAFRKDLKKSRFQFPEKLKEELRKDAYSYFDTDKPADQELYFDKESKYGKMFLQVMRTAKNEGRFNSVYLLRRAYVRENKNDCAFTLTANMGGGGHNVPVIEDQWGIRKLTPRECLRLQGFDEKFSFPEGMAKAKQYKQIGNAVTVDLVQRIAAECKKQLFSIERSSI